MSKRLSRRLAYGLAVTSLAASGAVAGENWMGASRGHGHNPVPTIGYTTPARQVPHVGTFSRSVWSVRTAERTLTEQPLVAPKAKVIYVDSGLAKQQAGPASGCSYESGVCVIRTRY